MFSVAAGSPRADFKDVSSRPISASILERAAIAVIFISAFDDRRGVGATSTGFAGTAVAGAADFELSVTFFCDAQPVNTMLPTKPSTIEARNTLIKHPFRWSR